MNNNIQWAIQKCLISEDLLEELKLACYKKNIDCYIFDFIPFSDSLPVFPDKKTIFYGSTSLMYLVYQDEKYNKGLFFNNNFSIENYLKEWKEYMLNFGAKILTFEELTALDYEDSKLLFTRPDADSKSFNGEVRRFDEIKSWSEKIKSTSTNIDKNTKIVVSEVYHISKEWRLWIVKSKVIASSKYRENFQLKKEEGCPQYVIDFAELRCKEYTPHDIFVMDIGLCGSDLYIIECGCMNSAGFYSANISNIVDSITNYFNNV